MKQQMVAVKLATKETEAKEAKTRTTSFLIKELHLVWKNNPELSDEMIVELYPEFEDIMKHIKHDNK